MKQGIKNLIYWFKVIWNDRDWDYSFMLILWRHKLKSMHKHYSNLNFFVGEERVARDTHRAVLALDRLIKEEYFLTKEYDRRVRINSRWAIDYSEKMAKQDINYFNKLIAKHYRSWWD